MSDQSDQIAAQLAHGAQPIIDQIVKLLDGDGLDAVQRSATVVTILQLIVMHAIACAFVPESRAAIVDTLMTKIKTSLRDAPPMLVTEADRGLRAVAGYGR